MPEDVQAARQTAVENDHADAEASFGYDDEQRDRSAGYCERDKSKPARREYIGKPSPKRVSQRAEQRANAERAAATAGDMPTSRR